MCCPSPVICKYFIEGRDPWERVGPQPIGADCLTHGSPQRGLFLISCCALIFLSGEHWVGAGMSFLCLNCHVKSLLALQLVSSLLFMQWLSSPRLKGEQCMCPLAFREPSGLLYGLAILALWRAQEKLCLGNITWAFPFAAYKKNSCYKVRP
jgi:hypothetical protein